MSACSKLLPLTRNCGGLSGGINRIWLFDPFDFDWTQTMFSTTTGFGSYTAVALTDAGTTATGKMLPIQFERDEAEYTYKQTRKGSFSKYEHTLTFSAADLSTQLTNWNYFIDQTSVCCGLGMVIQLFTGRMLVAGEVSINNAPIDIQMWFQQDGSSGSSGKMMDDFNGGQISIKANYKRMLLEYTGGLPAITALQ